MWHLKLLHSFLYVDRKVASPSWIGCVPVGDDLVLGVTL